MLASFFDSFIFTISPLSPYHLSLTNGSVYFVPAHRGQSEPETTERFAGMAQDGHDPDMRGLANRSEGLANRSVVGGYDVGMCASCRRAPGQPGP